MVDKRTWRLARITIDLPDKEKKKPVCLVYLRNLHNKLGEEIERLSNGQEEKEEKEGNAQEA